MTEQISDIAFTPAVKSIQTDRGSRGAYEQMEEKGGWSDVVTEDLAQFIAGRDSMYLGTASAEGQPYIQHRGGPAGFIKVIDEHTLAFADFTGNKQYISAGNLSENGKAYIFLMDYPNRYRIKIWGTARIVNDDPDLLAELADPGYRGKPEQAILFTVTAWDRNCPQHIQPRFTEAELDTRIARLERENAALRNQRDALQAALDDRM
jgi:predicted pyridoxine 5'-phosphate oxidase superfamily flavin-nucleotide-binding protein